MRPARANLASKIYSDEPIAAKPSASRKRKKGWWALAIVAMSFISIVTIVVLFYLSLCTQIVEDQYTLDHYEAMLPALREENANLDIQVRELGELGRIERIARNELHMGAPEGRLMIEADDALPLELAAQRQAEEGKAYAWKGTLQKVGPP